MKISVIGIVTGHINSLRNFRTGKLGLEAIIIPLALPLLAGVGAALAHPEVGEIERTGLIVLFANFAAALPILMVLMPALVRQKLLDGSLVEQRRTLTGETVTNVAFGVVVCLAAIPVLMLDTVVTVKYLTAFIAYSHVMLLLLTLRMVIKRVHVLVTKEVEESGS